MVDRVFKEGKFLNSPFLTFKFILSLDDSSPRVSFIVPKTVSKLAVKRNSLRRVGYNVLKKYISTLPQGLVGAFIFKKLIDSSSDLENEIKFILDKIR
mgnify:CR=1 FL=1